MQATLQISNADENLIKAIRGVVNLYPQAKLKVKKEDENYTKEFINSLEECEREFEEQRKNGTLKTYDNINDLRKALLSNG